MPKDSAPCEVSRFRSLYFTLHTSHFKLPVFLLGLILLTLAGCGQPQKQKPTPKLTVADHTTSVEDLALRLGLRVEERNETLVVLKNAANTVVIFTHTGGRFFVNGKPMGPVGEVKRQGNTVYVSDALIPQIRQYLRSATTPQPQPPVAPPSRPRTTKALVVIDAGHGGQDPGAISSTGLHEKDINLGVALKVAGILQQRGIGVVLTRQDDRFIELEERADMANRRNADLFVSIHSDSNPDRGRRGFTVYVAKGASSEARRAADSIHQTMAATGAESHGIREAEYKVLMNTTGPAVLVEIGHLSNLQDCARLRDSSYQNRLAQAIATGILAAVR